MLTKRVIIRNLLLFAFAFALAFAIAFPIARHQYAPRMVTDPEQIKWVCDEFHQYVHRMGYGHGPCEEAGTAVTPAPHPITKAP